MLAALSGQIIVTPDCRVPEFGGIIQGFEVTAIGMNVCGR